MRHVPHSITFVVLLLAAFGSGVQAGEVPRQDADGIPFLLTYPNLDNPDGEILLDNEHVVVQRFVVPPGEWEGIHSHPGNQVFIHIKGGTWAGRMGGVQSPTTSGRADGAVGWMDAIDLSEGHESGNVGDTTIDLVWVTLK